MNSFKRFLIVLALAGISLGAFAAAGRLRVPENTIEAAESLMETGSAVRAEERILTIVKENPSDLRAWRDLAHFYEDADRLEEALTAYQRLEELAAHTPNSRVDVARILIRLGREDEAEATLKDLLASYPFHRPALNLLGWLEIRRSGAKARTIRGFQPEENALTRAEKYFSRALEAEERDTEALIGRGVVAWWRKRPERAVQFFQAALEIDTKSYWAWMNLGSVLKELGRYEEAEKAFASADRLDPGRPYAAMARAALLRYLGRLREAVAAAPTFGTQGEFSRGMDLLAVGREEEAETAFLKVLETNPEDEIALNRLERVRMKIYPATDPARLVLARRRLEWAEEAERVRDTLRAFFNYRLAVKLAPQLSEVRLKMARFLSKEGLFSSAIEQLRHVEELTRSQHERLVASDMMEVITRNALAEMEAVHHVSLDDLKEKPTSELAKILEKPDALESRIRLSVTPVPPPLLRIAVLPYREVLAPRHVGIGRILAEWLGETLRLHPGFSVVSQDEIARVLKSAGVRSVEELDPGRIGELLGTSVVIQGDIFESPDRLVTVTRVITAPKGPILARYRLAAKGSQAMSRLALELSRRVSRDVPLKGRIVRRFGSEEVTVNLGRAHGLAPGDTVVVVRREQELFAPGLDWPSIREKRLVTGRVVGATEEYSEVKLDTPVAPIRAGDLVRREPKERRKTAANGT